jgi:hypothetical protein
MLLKNIAFFVIIFAISFYSIEIVDAQVISANQCTLGLPPLSTLSTEAKKDDIVAAYESKGYFVTILNSESQIHTQEFMGDASVDCLPTYFGIVAKTTVRIINTTTNNVTATATSPEKMDMFNCQIDLFRAIANLPECQIK